MAWGNILQYLFFLIVGCGLGLMLAFAFSTTVWGQRILDRAAGRKPFPELETRQPALSVSTQGMGRTSHSDCRSYQESIRELIARLRQFEVERRLLLQQEADLEEALRDHRIKLRRLEDELDGLLLEREVQAGRLAQAQVQNEALLTQVSRVQVVERYLLDATRRLRDERARARRLEAQLNQQTTPVGAPQKAAPTLGQIPGLSEKYAQRLKQNGITSVDLLARSTPEQVSEVAGLSATERHQSAIWIRVAKQLLDDSGNMIQA